MKLLQWLLLGASLVLCLPLGARSISEETPPFSCGKKLVVGITCSGKYCDNITPICGNKDRKEYKSHWTEFVSEEGSGTKNCNVSNPWERGDWPSGEPAFISGFSCKGKYCDNVALECMALRDAFPRSLGGASCYWTNWVSEETPTLRFKRGFRAIAMRCKGSYCDNKQFHICPIQNR